MRLCVMLTQAQWAVLDLMQCVVTLCIIQCGTLLGSFKQSSDVMLMTLQGVNIYLNK